MTILGIDIINIFIFSPLAGFLLLLFVREDSEKFIKWSAFFFTLLSLTAGLTIYFFYDPSAAGFQFTVKKSWIKALGINYHLGLDGLSLMLSLLTAFIMPVAVLSSFDFIKKSKKYYYAWLLLLETSVLGVFASMDMFLFYIFWEAMLIPMYFLIGIWGGERRIYATLKFFIYTMAASLFMLAAIIILFLTLRTQTGISSFSVEDFYRVSMGGKAALFCFFSFLLAFAVKVPLFPFHTWLPDAHVEAPTAASVILAGVLLKMGVYGYLRFMVPFFPELSVRFAPYISAFAAAGVIYASLAAWIQKDLKKLIAYSSVAHMGLIVLGILSFDKTAVSGAVLQMLNHGLSTGALFLLVGVIYERRHTRILEEYGGLFKVMPYFAFFFMIASLSSIGLPGLNGFVGEFLIFTGSFRVYPLLTAVCVSGVILSALYMLTAYEKLFYGPLSKKENASLKDLNTREWAYLLPLVIFMFYIGLYPAPFLTRVDKSVDSYISYVITGEKNEQ